MLLRSTNNMRSSELLWLPFLLTVLFFCGLSSAKGPPQELPKCDNVTKVNGYEELVLRYAERCNLNFTACTRYAWSTIGYPTLFITHDRTSCNCQCNYDIDKSSYTSNQKQGSVNITGTGSDFSLAIVFTRLMEFQVDPKKPKSYTVFNATEACESETESVEGFDSVRLSSQELNWTSFNDMLVGKMDTSDDLIEIKIYFPKKLNFERLPQFPKPQISENATLIDIGVHNIFNKTGGGRLALEMFIIHGPKVNNGTVTQSTYLDDEFTPSIFSSWTYNVPGRREDPANGDLGGYLHWKPISYQDSARKSTTSQQVNIVSAGDIPQCQPRSLPKGLATALFGDDVDPVSVSNVTRWFVVYGTDGDDTYLDPKYSTWTLVVGYGTVPSDSLSFTVIITIIVGLGVPGVLVIIGGVYVFIKKKPWQTASRLWARVRGRSGYVEL